MSEYKRLTRRNKDGTTWVKCSDCDNQDKCDITKESCCNYLQDRLAELEDKIENGTLVEFPFYVFDKKKNKEADCYKIALKEDWAKCLCYCDMEGFAITQDGMLILLDECGKYTYCPDNRFKVVAEARLKELQES